MARGEVAINLTTGLEIPAARGRRDRIASPDECATLLAALPRSDRALWATAMYGGLRRGELMALRVEDTENRGRIERAESEDDVDLIAPITLHECRHTFASLMIAARVNAKALSTCMGHSGISITLDRYGHLMPGNEAEAAGLLDAYLARADTKARLAALADTTGPHTGPHPGKSA